MLLHLEPGSLALGAPWLGYVVMAAAAVAAAGIEFSKPVAHDTALAPVGQMQFVASGSDLFTPITDVLDPFLEQKRVAKVEELPAQF